MQKQKATTLHAQRRRSYGMLDKPPEACMLLLHCCIHQTCPCLSSTAHELPTNHSAKWVLAKHYTLHQTGYPPTCWRVITGPASCVSTSTVSMLRSGPTRSTSLCKSRWGISHMPSASCVARVLSRGSRTMGSVKPCCRILLLQTCL